MAAPRHFKTAAAFRAWLRTNHARADELVVLFRKRAVKDPGMTWSESVDQALCYGWIDGVRRRVDEEHYSIRFTPRRPISTWSDVNLAKVAELERKGLMRKAGRDAFAKRKADKPKGYAYEKGRAVTLDAAASKRMRRDRKAWAFFERQPPSFRKKIETWIMSAKKPETRERRIAQALAAFREGRRD